MMQTIDFSNRQNRFIPLTDVSEDYLLTIEQKTKQDSFYPSYHIAPHHGLLNDPNGLAYFNGRHHIFYQWFPLGPVHGLKHWYHVSTEDFVEFEDHGIALYPDSEADSHGCFSGAGYVEDDELHLFYTGNQHAGELPNPTQIHATMDAEGNVEKQDVLAWAPPVGFTHHFRDPLVFKRGSEYFMLVGGEDVNHRGALALYKGATMREMDFVGVVETAFENSGYMWECPNYFEKDDRGVLIFSPQGELPQDRYSYNNVFSVVYAVSERIDVEDPSFGATSFVELDKGFDFYAPQTYRDGVGRQILIGWLGNSKSDYPTDDNMWAHMLTIPREVTIDGDRLKQWPLQELENLRETSGALESVQRLSSQAFELELEVEEAFKVVLRNEAGEELVFSGDREEYVLDRSRTTYPFAERFGSVRYAERQVKGKHTIRVFVDHSSIEMFCDEGATVFTSRFFIEDLCELSVEGACGTLFGMKGFGVCGDGSRV